MPEKFHKRPGTLLVLAGLFVGLGVGVLINNVAPGVLIGLGIGFLAAYISRIVIK